MKCTLIQPSYSLYGCVWCGISPVVLFSMEDGSTFNPNMVRCELTLMPQRFNVDLLCVCMFHGIRPVRMGTFVSVWCPSVTAYLCYEQSLILGSILQEELRKKRGVNERTICLLIFPYVSDALDSSALLCSLPKARRVQNGFVRSCALPWISPN